MMDSIPIPLQDHLPSHADIVLDHRDDHEDHDDDDEHDEEQPADCPAPAPAPSGTENGSVELWSKQSRPRGRRARDPDAEVVRFDCKDIDDLETNLRDYLEAPTADAEHATVEFHFPVTAAFMVYTRDFKRDSTTNWTSADVTDLMRKTAVSVYEVLQETQNPKDQIVRQKAVGRTIVEAVQRADKFRYSFHNNWLSREDQAHRFSFFCNDSTLNKGRAANGGAGTEGKARRKPVYDCKGLIAVKFSVTKQNLEVHYKHVPIHKTFDERAPLPRRESKRRRMMEVLDPAGLKAMREERRKRRREERLAAGWVPSKGGRQKPEPEVTVSPLQRRRRYSEGPQTTNTNEQTIADEGLQPLLEFLGSAERTGGSEDDNDDGIIMTNRDGHPLQGRGSDARPTTPPAFPREKSSDVRKTVPRRRAKYHGPLLPGMMEGTLQSGNMSWNVATPTNPAEAQPSQVSSTKLTTDKQKQKRKQREETEEDRGGEPKRQNREEETELEQLKRRLYETEQRLMKIEAEKGVAANSNVPPPPPQPPAYPQYPQYPYYPYYTYPPPPHPHYLVPPQSQLPPSPAPTSVGGPQQPAWRQYQPSHKSVAAPPQSQQPADGPPPSTSQQASSQQVPAQNLTGQMSIDQTVVQHPAMDSEPTQSARVDSVYEFAAKGDTGQERLQGETGSQSRTLARQPTIENRIIPAPAPESQSTAGTSVPTTKSAAQTQPSTSSDNQIPRQVPSQIASASLGKTRPDPPSWVQYSPKSSDAQATSRSSDPGPGPGPAPQKSTRSSSSNKRTSKRSPPRPARGRVKLNDSRHIAPAAGSDDREDSHLKGLFDSAMAAIIRPEGVAVTNNNRTTTAAATAPIEASSANTTCGPTHRIAKESQSSLSPSGASSFRLPKHKTPPTNFYKYGDSNHDKSRDSGGKTSTKPSGTNGTPVAPPYPPPYYPYPPPPHQQSYPPPPLGPPPPGYPPYPPPGYPPYPPLPGYGYPPYPAYQYPPAPAPHLTETEEQRKAREQKEKDGREGAPGWATQLREAMQGYASSIPVSTSTGKKKPAEARDESVVVTKEGQIASDPANRSSKDTGQVGEREVIQIDSNIEDDREVAEQSWDGG